MAIPTRETSGLTCLIDAKGRMSLHMNSERVPGILELKTETVGRDRGVITVKLMSQFVTFEHIQAVEEESSPPVDDDWYLRRVRSRPVD